ncbi:hypothetical protein UAW_01403 [Enterococcus haemoperoxidus ATCC BAA-382]|uniref:Uncharacterized protein n=1 Tax=Enterococcus haemoperoxidus ATCC BAA-382 TaxID=1158608 RepID=R2QNV9_9ENTE|nr:hypothetical protein [Enterococcus haemoperoxidus]EOH98222.1 hypothetical protein UAW_01403 [Enterococcus haemoperoxidus ATCC BAA-382]EOT59735.1 hypothetical protein I583_02370 [Enterococcus haemoperoxidus ATCC BAA-382]OJG55916.1 hypothetical protein RV06_GL000032 [Enterococcus haemoperoxidus]
MPNKILDNSFIKIPDQSVLIYVWIGTIILGIVLLIMGLILGKRNKSKNKNVSKVLIWGGVVIVLAQGAQLLTSLL